MQQLTENKDGEAFGVEYYKINSRMETHCKNSALMSMVFYCMAFQEKDSVSKRSPTY